MIDINKLINIIQKYRRIQLNGTFESGIIINDEKIVIKTNRVIKIYKYFDRYKFYMNGEYQIVKENRLIEIFNNLVTVKVNKVSIIK